MSKNTVRSVLIALLLMLCVNAFSQERRPIDSKHPLWLVHIDVWNKADPQKIIDLIPNSVKPYVCMNLSLSCQYDKEKDVYKMPQNAIRTYKLWASVCQANGMWFTCQPASGGHTHIQDDDLETFEYFYRRYPNFLGWNYAEQFWGFNEPGDKSSSSDASRIALFAKLVPMAHKYGGFLTVSFCGNIWSHALNPVAMMKRNPDLLNACRKYPEAMLWLYKYTTSSCFYNNESVTYSPFISGLAKNYGVRYDNCGWNGALDGILGEKSGKTYPVAAGIGTVMEQTGVNGGAVWDGPELIWTEDFQEKDAVYRDGYRCRQWGCYPGFNNAWLDMFQKIIDGSLYIPSREEIIGKTKLIVINDVSSGDIENMYAAWGDLYDGLYKQDDPFNRGNGQWMDNFCYFKKSGRYGAIPVAIEAYDELAKSIPVKVNKSTHATRWPKISDKVTEMNSLYPEVSTGDMYVNRYRNQLITYTPYTYLNSHTTSSAQIPLKYNTCQSLDLKWGKLSSGLIREYSDHIVFYLNNYRTDTIAPQSDVISINGAVQKPAFSISTRANAKASTQEKWESGVYTLVVSHMGPVDVRISCSGNATDRSTDILPDNSLSDDAPRQPQGFDGELIVEAEDMDSKNIRTSTVDAYITHPNERGHSGNGFVDMGTSTYGSIRHVFNMKKGGAYKISVRYMSVYRDGNFSAVVNGVRQTVACSKTASNEWKKVTFNAELKGGSNTFVIDNTSGLDFSIDNVTYRPADMLDEKYLVTIRESEMGSAYADVDEATEGTLVTLNVTPKPGYALEGWRIVHGNVNISSDGQFTMPDDNVTLEPVFKDLTSVYSLDFANVSGNFPPGWLTVQENNETHQYPNSYGLGARILSGFAGYTGNALYWREQYAQYGSQSGYNLSLSPGKYKLKFAMAGWKQNPRYKVQILSVSPQMVIAESGEYVAAPDAAGNTGANVSGAELKEFEFNVASSNLYIVRFVNTDYISGYDEFLLLSCEIRKVLDSNDVEIVPTDNIGISEIYNLQGVRQATLQRGVNIIRMSNGHTIKVVKE